MTHPEIRPHHYHHHSRFYIFMITLIIIGVFFVLYSNNGKPGTSIGSAIVGYAVGDTNVKQLPQEAFNLNNNVQNTKTTSKEIPLKLSFDQIPVVDEETGIGTVTLNFNNQDVPIDINNEKLELNGVEEVNFVINGFSGKLGLSDGKLSLSGNAKDMEINGLKFSSQEDIKISFEELDYNLVDLTEISLKDLKFTKGNGDIKIGEKLDYPLEDEEVELLDFNGEMKVDENSNSSLIGLNGIAGGASVSGDALDLNLW